MENKKKKIEAEYGEDVASTIIESSAFIESSAEGGAESLRAERGLIGRETLAIEPLDGSRVFENQRGERSDSTLKRGLIEDDGTEAIGGFTDNRGFTAQGFTGIAEGVAGSNMAGNKVFLKGKVDSKLHYSHELYGEGFYEFFLLVPRLSQQFDRLPITVSERLLEDIDLSVGATVSLNGQFRSYNKLDGERSKLMLTVFARDFVLSSEDINPNIAELSGYICKPPVYRTTPFNREICDLLLAVNRAYNKSDYIPCIAWGRNARFVKTISVGQRLLVSGRIQSREYNKKIGDDQIEVRTAYELSINKIIVE